MMEVGLLIGGFIGILIVKKLFEAGSQGLWLVAVVLALAIMAAASR